MHKSRGRQPALWFLNYVQMAWLTTLIDFDWPAQPNAKPPKPGYPEKEPKMSHFEKMMDTMAVWHSHHWPLVEKPGLSWINRADGPAFALIEGETKAT